MGLKSETKMVIEKVQREIDKRNKEEQEKATNKRLEAEQLKITPAVVPVFKKEKSVLPKKLIKVLKSFNSKKP